MINTSFTMQQLEYFIVTYQQRSYAAAAKAIPMTYQGLRKALDKLEQQLDKPLFIMRDNELEPTRYADLVYDFALRWMRDVKRLDRAFEEPHAKAARTVVSICASRGAPASLGHDVLARFSDEYPDLALSIYEAADKQVDALLENGEYALGITVGPFSDRLVSEPLIDIQPFAFLNRANPLAQKEYLVLEDFESQSIMIADENNKSYDYYREELRRRGVLPASIVTSSDVYWSYHYALSNMGIGTACDMDTCRSLITDDAVVLLPIRDGYLYRVAVSHRLGYEPTKREQIVIDFLRRMVSVS